MSNIQVGDLVILLGERACKCNHQNKHTGKIFTVCELAGPVDWTCGCGDRTGHGITAKTDAGNWFATWRLKRIPPLGELEDIKTAEELTA